MSRRSRKRGAANPSALPIWCAAAAVFGIGFAGLLVNRLSQAPELPLGHLRAAAFFLTVLGVLAAVSGRGESVRLLAAAWTLVGMGLLARLRLGGAETAWPTLRADWGLPIGAVLLIGVYRTLRAGRHRSLESVWWAAGLLALGVLAFLLAMGRRFRGGLYLFGLTNPSEAAKLFLPLCFAGVLARREVGPGRGWLPALSPGTVMALAVFGGGSLLLLALVRDFGFALLLAATVVVMFALATGRPSHALAGLLLAALAAAAAFHWVPHARIRWDVWRDPFRDEAGSGWQSLQGLAALYHGGLWGRGLGAGFPHLVPIASSDFVYAVWGEEIGFAGCGLMLLLYLVVFSSGLRISGAQRDPFSRLLAGGLTTALAAQTLVHVAGVTKAMPLTGVPLPFVSHGGSSLVVSLAAVGLLAAIGESAAGGAPRPNRKSNRK